MAESNVSRGNLLQDKIWISGRPIIKISAGFYWELLGSKPVDFNLGWVRVHWTRQHIML